MAVDNAIDAFLLADSKAFRGLDRRSLSRTQRRECDLLFAWALLRTGQSSAARKALAAIPREGLSSKQRATHSILMTASRSEATNGRKPTSRCRAFSTDPALNSTTSARRDESAYLHALTLLTEHRLDEAETVASEALSVSDDFTNLRLLELLGWIEFAGGSSFRLRENHYFSSGLIEIRSRAHHTETLNAAAIHGATIVAVETMNKGLATTVRRALPNVPWERGDRWRHAQVETHLGRLAELEGDKSDAWRHFEIAKSMDVTASHRCLAMISQANLLLRAGEDFSASRVLDDTWRLLSSIAWSCSTVEEQKVLLAYAFVAAQSDHASASEALRAVRSMRKGRPRTALLHDSRIDAMLRQAAGAISLAHGESDAAHDDLRAAFEIWRRLRYRVRSGTIALMLWQLTGADEYSSYLNGLRRKAPRAWFSTRQNDRIAQAVAALTPAERRVLQQLLLGKSAKEIADELDRSVFTIRNQTKKIFAAFGVHTRASLLATCVISGTRGHDFR